MLGVLGIFKARGTKVFNEMVGKTAEAAGGGLTSLMPIKCILETQIYGPFLVNMALPPLLGLVVMLAMIPITFSRRATERFLRDHDDEMKTRREKAAIHLEDSTDADIILPPRWEPIVNFCNCEPRSRFQQLLFKCPSKTAVKIPICRKVPSEEYIINYLREKEGLRPNAPRYETRLGVNASLAGGIPHALLMAFESCRVESTEKAKRAWRAERAVYEQRVNFKPIRRVVAVMVSARNSPEGEMQSSSLLPFGAHTITILIPPCAGPWNLFSLPNTGRLNRLHLQLHRRDQWQALPCC